jgi:alkaline phosphatase D
MLKHNTAFTLWGGDNIYLREVDWSSESGINYRYHHTRNTPEVQRIMSSRPNYAIWDDHDFGPNNSHRAYPLRKASLDAFKNWWGNKTYGESSNLGTYSKFQWSDADFFLLDNRYHRSPNKMPDDNEKSYLGKRQLQWLKESLIESRASFKLIVNGNQFFNTYAYNECFKLYSHEFNSLIDFIKSNNIRGVVFLSGDRHLSEMYKIENSDFYPFYEVTCSPFTPKSYDISDRPEFNNPVRINGSLIMEQNFMKISVTGSRNDRKLIIQAFDLNNQLIFEQIISKSELRVSKSKE